MKHARAAAARRVLLGALALLFAFLAAIAFATRVPAVRAYVLRELESRLTRYTGHEIRAERVEFHPLRGELELHNVRVADGPGPADEALLAADSIRLGWHWKPLL